MYQDPDPVWQRRRSAIVDPQKHLLLAVGAIALIVGMWVGVILGAR